MILIVNINNTFIDDLTTGWDLLQQTYFRMRT